MTAIYGVLGGPDSGRLERMGDRFAHRGECRREWKAASGLWLGARWKEGEDPPAPTSGGAALVDGRVSRRSDASSASAGLRDPLESARLLVDGVDESGPSFFATVRGPFAAIVSTSRRIVLACDPHGYRQLYYCRTGQRVLFASEYKAILADPDVSARVDREALQLVQESKNQPARRSCIEGIRRVPSGCFLELETSSLSPRRYWSFDRPVTSSETPGQVGELRKRLLRAIERQAGDADPIGVSLSGGLDSSVVVALLRQLHPNRTIHTFSAGYGPDDPELQGAAELASHFGTEHHELVLEPDRLPSLLPEAVYYTEQPVGREDIPYLLFTCRRASEFVDKLFSGYDADLLFGGMPRHLLFRAGTAVPPLRVPLRSFLQYARYGRLPSSASGKLLVKMYYRGKEVAAPRIVGLPEVDSPRSPVWEGSGDARPLTSHLAHQAENTSHGAYDAIHQACGLEMYSPFGDQELIDWAFRLPDDVKIRFRRQKWVLREAVKGAVPDSVRTRSKTLQRLRHGRVFSDVLEAMAGELLDLDCVRERGLFDPEYVDRVKTRPEGGAYSDEQAYRLWTMILTEIWARTFLDGNGERPLSPIL